MVRTCGYCKKTYIHREGVQLDNCQHCGEMNNKQEDIRVCKGGALMGSGADGMNDNDVPAESKQEQLASAHWQYIESVLRQHGESEDVIAKCGHHYRASFVHGWKHCHEEYGYARFRAA